jgi:hypothetical protein
MNNTPNQTPTPPSSGLDPQKVRADLENIFRQAAKTQGQAPAEKPAGQ